MKMRFGYSFLVFTLSPASQELSKRASLEFIKRANCVITFCFFFSVKFLRFQRTFYKKFFGRVSKGTESLWRVLRAEP